MPGFIVLAAARLLPGVLTARAELAVLDADLKARSGPTALMDAYGWALACPLFEMAAAANSVPTGISVALEKFPTDIPLTCDDEGYVSGRMPS
jgi:hypothetical protein